MQINYSKALGWIRWASAGLVTFTVVTVAGGFVLQLCAVAPWYEHAWDTVARITAIVLGIVGSAWFHWIGGLSVGFAVGIWLDDLLRRLVSRQNPIIERPKSEKGFLDYQLDVATSMVGMMKLMTKITDRTNWIGDRIRGQTEKNKRLLASINARGEPLKSDLVRAHNISSGAAKYYDKYCSDVAESEKRLGEIAHTMMVAIKWLYNNPQWRTETAFAELTTFKNQVSGAKVGIDGFADSVKGLWGTSATLNESIGRTVGMLKSLSTTIGFIDGFCTTILKEWIEDSAKTQLAVPSHPTSEDKPSAE